MTQIAKTLRGFLGSAVAPWLGLAVMLGLIAVYLALVPWILENGIGPLTRGYQPVSAGGMILTVLALLGPAAALLGWIVNLIVGLNRSEPGSQTALSFSVFVFSILIVLILAINLSLPSASQGWETRVAELDPQSTVDALNESALQTLKDLYASRFTTDERAAVAWEESELGGDFLNPELVAAMLPPTVSVTQLAAALPYPLAMLTDTEILPVQNAEEQVSYFAIRVSPVSSSRSYLQLMPLADEHSQLLSSQAGLRDLALLANDAPRLLEDFRWVILLISAPVAVAALLMILIVTRRIVRPIGELIRGTSEVSKGELTVQIQTERADEPELQKLTRAFNDMVTELHNQQEALIHSQKIAAWSEVARRLAHEVKNPLTPIKLAAQRMRLQHAKQNPKFAEILEDATSVIIRETDRLHDLVNEFSAFARLPQLRLRKTNAEQLFRQSLEVVEPQASGLELQPVIEAHDSYDVIWDPDKMTQVMINLLKNAIEACAPGDQIEAHMTRRNSEVRILISDSGAGMSEDVRKQLFTPYFTTKQEGTGLGLVIIKKIIEEHGGRIQVTSQEGKGSSFLVVLPVDPSELRHNGS